MEVKYFVEGHKPKADYADENTLIIEPEVAFTSVEDAIAEARSLFEQKNELGLAVILKEGYSGDRELVKFLFRDDTGGVDEYPFW